MQNYNDIQENTINSLKQKNKQLLNINTELNSQIIMLKQKIEQLHYEIRKKDKLMLNQSQLESQQPAVIEREAKPSKKSEEQKISEATAVYHEIQTRERRRLTKAFHLIYCLISKCLNLIDVYITKNKLMSNFTQNHHHNQDFTYQAFLKLDLNDMNYQQTNYYLFKFKCIVHVVTASIRLRKKQRDLFNHLGRLVNYLEVQNFIDPKDYGIVCFTDLSDSLDSLFLDQQQDRCQQLTLMIVKLSKFMILQKRKNLKTGDDLIEEGLDKNLMTSQIFSFGNK